MAFNLYLAQLEHPQISFAVKQKNPDSLDAAVIATLEMESCLSPTAATGAPVFSVKEESKPEAVVAAVTPSKKLLNLVMKLAERIKQLKQKVEKSDTVSKETTQDKTSGKPQNSPPGEQQPGTRSCRPFIGECWRCHKYGHPARNHRLSLP